MKIEPTSKKITTNFVCFSKPLFLSHLDHLRRAGSVSLSCYKVLHSGVRKSCFKIIQQFMARLSRGFRFRSLKLQRKYEYFDQDYFKVYEANSVT